MKNKVESRGPDSVGVNPQAPVAQKRMRWFFDISKVNESSFLKSDPTDPPQIFDAHLLENTDLSPSRFHF